MYGLTTEYDKKLNIALDYDETFTAHRELWTNFVKLAKRLNCEVTFVTYRLQGKTYGNGDIIEDAKNLNIPIVFSNGEPKSGVFKADIWIDDQPITIPSYQAMIDIL